MVRVPLSSPRHARTRVWAVRGVTLAAWLLVTLVLHSQLPAGSAHTQLGAGAGPDTSVPPGVAVVEGHSAATGECDHPTDVEHGAPSCGGAHDTESCGARASGEGTGSAKANDNADGGANVVFAAGLSFAFVGTLTAAIMNAFYRGYYWFVNRFVCTVSMTSHEEMFRAVLFWMSRQPSTLSGTNVVVEVKKDKTSHWIKSDIDSKSSMEYLPGRGLHVIRYKGRTLWVERVQQEVTTTGWEREMTELETLTLSYIGRDASLFSQLFDDALALTEDKNHEQTHVWEMHFWGFWVKAHSRAPRPLRSVILDRDVGSELVNDAQRFFDSEGWYAKRGIPYRRGYLLYGPPGCGKTTFVTALAGALKRSICVLTLASNELSDEDLRRMLHSAPRRSIMLLEDVDAVFSGRESSGDMRRQSVSFSGLLNAIDGVASQEGRLLFMTTNHIERLDPALIRPGRCDVHVKFDYATHNQIQRMFSAFFPPETRGLNASGSGDTAAGLVANEVPAPSPLRRQLSVEFKKALPEGKLTMAQLQAHFMRYKTSPEQALANVEQLVAQEASVRLSSVHLLKWLRRLGLEQYYPGFARAKMFTVEDIKSMGESEIASFGVTVPAHAKRIYHMLQGRSDVRAQFNFVTSAQAEAVFLQFYAADTTAGDLDAALAGDSVSTSSAKPQSAGAGVGTGAGAPAMPPLQRQASMSTHDLATLARKFGQQVPPVTLSVAQVMKLCAQHVDNPAAAVRDLPGLIEEVQAPLKIDAAAIAGLAATADDELDAMDLRVWLGRLGMLQYLNKMRESGLATAADLRAKRGQLASFGVKALGHRTTITGMLDGDPTVRNSFAFLTTKEDAARVLTAAVSEACGTSITPTSDAIGRFAAGVPMPVCDGSTVAGRGVTFAMAAAHCKRFVLFNEAGFEDLDQTGGRAADLVSQLADAAVPADPTARLPPDEFLSPAMAAALALPLQDVITRLGLGAFMSGARKAGAHVAQDLLRNELGLCGVKGVGPGARLRAFRAGDESVLAGMALLTRRDQVAAVFHKVFADDATPAPDVSIPRGKRAGGTGSRKDRNRKRSKSKGRSKSTDSAGTAASTSSAPGESLAQQYAASVPLGLSALQVLDHCNSCEGNPTKAVATAAHAGEVDVDDKPKSGAGAPEGDTAATSSVASKFTPKSPVAEWLAAAGLGDHAATFTAQGFVTVADACELSDEQMVELGLARLGDRKRLARAVRRVRAAAA